MNWKVKSILINVGWFLVVLMLFLWLSSCNPQKRLSRIIKNNPELLQKDTIRDTTLVVIPEVHTDTILSLDSIRDTVTITKDRLKIRTVYKDNNIYISGECETDTVEVIKEIPVEKIVIKEPTWFDNNKWWIYLLIGVTVIAAIRKKIGLF